MSGNQDLIDQLLKAAGAEHFSIGFRMMLNKAANIIAAHENPIDRARPLGPAKNWYENPRELEERTIGLCKPLQNGACIMATPTGNVVVHDDVTSLGFMITREEFIDGVYSTVIPQRWAELMRQRVLRAATPYDLDVDPELMRPRKEEGLGAPDKPAT